MTEPAAVPESTELLPCPFCGNVAIIGDIGDKNPFWRVKCTVCLTIQNDSTSTREDAVARWNIRKPAASPVAGVSAEKNYHFSDQQVMDALVGTDYLRTNVGFHLIHMTSGEKWSLYRAIVKLAKGDRNG